MLANVYDFLPADLPLHAGCQVNDSVLFVSIKQHKFGQKKAVVKKSYNILRTLSTIFKFEWFTPSFTFQF